jgi:hypothetical protein
MTKLFFGMPDVASLLFPRQYGPWTRKTDINLKSLFAKKNLRFYSKLIEPYQHLKEAPQCFICT